MQDEEVNWKRKHNLQESNSYSFLFYFIYFPFT